MKSFHYIPENESEQDVLGWNTSHEDGELQRFFDEYCQQMGYNWFPQASSVKYASILDLGIFP